MATPYPTDGNIESAAPPPPPWESHRRARKPVPPRREPLNLDRIADAAFAVLDREGLEALTMRKVATELKYTVSALYVHIRGRDELLQVLHEKVYENFHVPNPHPDPDEWRNQVKALASDLLVLLQSHRDMARISMGRLPTGPAMIVQMERLLAFFLAGGLPPAIALRASDMLSLIVEGVSLEAEMWSSRTPADAAFSPADYFAALPPSRFPNLSRNADMLVNDSQAERFEAIIGIFINGLMALRTDAEGGGPEAGT